MTQVSWRYYFARKFSLQRFEVVWRVFISDFYFQHFGVRLNNIMIKPETGGNHAIWLEDKKYQQAINKIFKVVCRNLKNFYYYKRIIKKVQQDWLKAAIKVSQLAKPTSSLKELTKLYDIFIHYHQELFNKPIWIIFPIEPVLSQKVEKILRAVLQRTGKIKEYDKYLNIIFSPEEKNAITAMEEMVLTEAIKYKKNKSGLEKSAVKLSKSYGFIPCYDVIDNPWDASHFKKEIINISKKPLNELTAQLKDIKIRFIRHRQDFQKFLKQIKMQKFERELFIMAHEIVFIKDERDDYRRRGSGAGQNLFNQIGKKLGISRREVCYLSIDELRQALKHGLSISQKKLIKERLQGYLLLRKNGQPMVIASGQTIKRLLNQELGQATEIQAKEITGKIGATGLTKGPVVIIHTKHDLRKVFDGCVMVSVTTNPDYVPAMKICCAFVTDEGGITSHAAIVARELKRPCIVGTIKGTQIFKDGDLVEVDANKGIVKKLN